ncbi:MAG TPA: hypothetical protein VEY31_13495 [Roseococcus sp.]|nr:hypothetical protein [Roseococcus sp.]
MLTIACLHTATSNVAVFEAAKAALPVAALRLRHEVRLDLLRAPDDATLAEAAAALARLAPGVDAVLLTCSTIGAAVAQAQLPCPVLRADAALAEAATRGGGRVSVLYAAPDTRESTAAIFGAAAERHGASVMLKCCEGAWPLFLAGELQRYLALVALEAGRAPGRVALAQASMAGAAALMKTPPLTVPTTALMAAARAALASRRAAPSGMR